MHIILVSNKLATARSIHLGWRHFVSLVALFIAVVFVTSSLFSYLAVRHAAALDLPFLPGLSAGKKAEDAQRSQEFVRENLNAMAVKIGKLQAQLMRLDSLGERIAAISGVAPAAESRSVPPAGKDGRGGPLVNAQPLSEAELQRSLDELSRQLDVRGDNLVMLESQLLDERLRKNMLPTTLPVAVPWISSYGWRIDPITGERAMHEGVDFPSDVGTPVIAAAGGVVITSERHPEYGNMLEIDHGNGLTTRYAHLSRIIVKQGTLVRRGQRIAEVGNTGRSTGPHLHFEVRLDGRAQNPSRFLQSASAVRSAKSHLASRR